VVEKGAERGRLNWRLPLYVVAGASIVLLSLMVYSADGDLLYILVIAPLVCLICLVLLLTAAILKRSRQFLSTLLTLVAFIAVSGALLKNEGTLRPSIRWLLWSHRFKAEVMAQQNPSNAELKHIEWDGWGFPGAGDTTVYLVFDPTDSLAVAAKSHQPGKFHGIPCTVPRVSRLEGRWYAVLFYTDERWGKQHWDCGMKD
jgi:hypothetical protein